jgi:hypothetical protein
MPGGAGADARIARYDGAGTGEAPAEDEAGNASAFEEADSGL